MPRLLQFAIFLSIVLAITAGLHVYVYVRLIRDTALADPWRRVAIFALVALALSIPASFFFLRSMSPEVARVVLFPVNVWMGVLFLLFVLFIAGDIIRLILFTTGAAPTDPGRRLFLARAFAAATVGIASAVGLLGVRQALAGLRVKKVRVTLDRLPRELDGTTIVQLTDVHIGPTLGRGFLEEVVARTNALQPDIVAITGDLVDGTVEQLRDAVAPLADLKATQGVFFVTGNHEYYVGGTSAEAGADEWIAELSRLGIRTLRNERVSIERGGVGFDLAGIFDWSAREMRGGHAPDLRRALSGRNPARELVLLAHQPKAVVEAAALGVGLQLSGHTHGGQIWPFNYLVRLEQPHVSGLGRRGATQIYVSPGTGFWGPPMRIGTTSEITHIVLASRTA